MALDSFIMNLYMLEKQKITEYFLEKSYFGEVAELIERKSVHVNDLNQAKLYVEHILELDENHS